MSVFQKVSCAIPHVHATNAETTPISNKKDKMQDVSCLKETLMLFRINLKLSEENNLLNWHISVVVTARKQIVSKNIVNAFTPESNAHIFVSAKTV